MTGEQQHFCGEMLKLLKEKKKNPADPDPSISYDPRTEQPTISSLEAYFAALADDPFDALKAYSTYARAFYSDAPADVDWGTNRCSSWDQITRRASSAKDGRRAIDCEGYSYIAQRLLSRAAWQLIGYRIFFNSKNRHLPEWHIAADLKYAGTAKASIADLDYPRRAIIGTSAVSDSPYNECKHAYQGNLERFEKDITYTEPLPTQVEAFNRADQITRTGAAETGAATPIAQVRAPMGPAGSIPPRGPARWC